MAASTPDPRARSAPRARVAIIGAGVAGLTAAHELSKLGFQVTVFERRSEEDGRRGPAPKSADASAGGAVVGGKAWSYQSLAHPGSKKRLPAEHGFRFFPGFYRHLIDTMQEIPSTIPAPASVAAIKDTVATHLVQTDVANVRRKNGTGVSVPVYSEKQKERMHVSFLWWLGAFWREHQRELPSPPESLLFAAYVLQYVTSSPQRADRQWQRRSWWDYVQAWRRSEEYQQFFARGLTRTFVATKAEEMNANTGAAILMQLLYDLWPKNTGRPAADRLLDGPTTDVWLKPWYEALRQGWILDGAGKRRKVVDAKGKPSHPLPAVTFEFGAQIGKLIASDGKLTELRLVSGDNPVDEPFDYYISALPIDQLQEVLVRSPSVLEADENLRNLFLLETSWMNGIVFYLDVEPARLGLPKGHVLCLDSEWALTLVEQTQFWEPKWKPDGCQSVVSVDISDWDTPGTTGLPASRMTRPEIAAEVWRQLVAHVPELETAHDGQPIAFSLDMGINLTLANPMGVPNGRGRVLRPTNAEPLLVNTEGSWRHRPQARTALSNFFIAGDFVQTFTDFASMEAANEAAKRAVNALVAEHERRPSNTSGCAEINTELEGPCVIHPLGLPRPPVLRHVVELMRWLDGPLYQAGLPPVGLPMVSLARLTCVPWAVFETIRRPFGRPASDDATKETNSGAGAAKLAREWFDLSCDPDQPAR